MKDAHSNRRVMNAFPINALLRPKMAGRNALAYRWTPQETKRLITFRADHEQDFHKSKFNAKILWMKLVQELGLEGKVTAKQVSKKWENLKKKYKDQTTIGTWQYFEVMHQVLGDGPAVDPSVVVSSFPPSTPLLVKEEAEPSTPESSCQQSPDASASGAASPCPSPPAKRQRLSTNPVLDFLKEEAKREQRRHEESEAKTERFLDLFELLVDKM